LVNGQEDLRGIGDEKQPFQAVSGVLRTGYAIFTSLCVGFTPPFGNHIRRQMVIQHTDGQPRLTA